MKRTSQRGLTLIEVLAAIVIFSTGAVVLFGWIGQMADRLALVNKEERLLFAQLTALEFARTINPMQKPAGTEQIGATTVRWDSQEVGTAAAAYNPAGADGAYLVQLYRVNLQIEESTDLVARRELYLAGWRQTRPVGARAFFDNGAPSGGATRTP